MRRDLNFLRASVNYLGVIGRYLDAAVVFVAFVPSISAH